MNAKPPVTSFPLVPGEICILAGGLSSRMGRDKARLRFRGQTFLARVKFAAAESTWPLRVIRHDLVPRCGPLGGVFTALKTTQAEAVLFLACDMPFVTAELLAKLVELSKAPRRAVFTMGERGAGFPFLLRRIALPQVEEQIAAGQFSLQALAATCHARIIRVPGNALVLFNVNTPADWKRAPNGGSAMKK